MIDFIKYFPIKMRQQYDHCIPKGPSIKNAKKITCTIGETKLLLKAPRHSPKRSTTPKIDPDKRDITNFSFEDSGDNSNCKWKECNFFVRQWAFWGPWFTGAQADVSMVIGLCKLKDQKEGLTFFNPRYFEGCIADLLTEKHGHRKSKKGEPYFQGPLNWKAHTDMNVFSATFGVDPIQLGFFAPQRKYIAFPISENSLILASLGLSINKTGDLKERQSQVDTSEAQQLIDDIISSFEIELGPKAKAELELAKVENPNLTLCETFAPLKWPVPEQQEKKVEQLSSQSWGVGD